MNCKPGDLAVVVSTAGRHEFDAFLGAVVSIDKAHFPTISYGHMWRLVEPVTRGGMHVDAIADVCLRPMRDPGDDAVDESKAWLPPVPLPTIDPSLLPTKETA